MRKIISYKEENRLYICQMKYREGTTGVAYLNKAEFLRTQLEEILEKIDPSLIKKLDEVISLSIEENRLQELD